METKWCYRCQNDVPRDQFYPVASKADGLSSECKPCRIAVSREYRAKKAAERKVRGEYPRQPQTQEELLRRTRKHLRAGDVARNKRVARYTVKQALIFGLLTRPARCQHCGAEASGVNMQAHHHDYDQPLAVWWLCRPCHHALHSPNPMAFRVRGSGITLPGDAQPVAVRGPQKSVGAPYRCFACCSRVESLMTIRVGGERFRICSSCVHCIHVATASIIPLRGESER